MGLYVQGHDNKTDPVLLKNRIMKGLRGMSTGQVKWFNNAKGFGFILPDDGGDDLFAHYSAIGMEGYKTLKAGQLVSFETQEGPKGLHATNIKPLSDPPKEQAEPVASAENDAETGDLEAAANQS